MTAVHRLITPSGSNMLCAVNTAEERQACPFNESGFCIGVVLAWKADPRTVQVVVLTLYEMECLKPLNPTVSTMVIFSHSRDFPFYFWWFIFNFGCIPRTSCCVRIVLYFAVLTLYEMECVKLLNPTVVLRLLLAIPEIFLFISDDSSLILVAYLVHLSLIHISEPTRPY